MGILSELDKVAGDVLKDTRDILIFIGRLLLISTFIEDGFRMWHQRTEHTEYIGNTWNWQTEIATVVVGINLAGQVLGAVMVLFRILVTPSVVALTLIVIIQTIVYSIIFDVKFLMRHLAMIGALLLLLAEHKDRRAQQQKKKTIVGLPVLDEHSPSSGLQFFGRIFLVLLFCTLLHFWGWTAAAENFKNDEDALEDLIGIKKEVLNDTFGLFFILLIVAGWKTRLCSLILIIWLGCLNFFVNDFWSHSDTSMMYDFKRYDFFQTLTVIGGLKILIALGPGHYSLDYEKKGI